MRDHNLVPNSLRVPENLLRIYHLFERSQSRVSGDIVIQAVCLCCRQAGVNVIQICAEGSLGLSVDEGTVQPIDECSACRRERRGEAGETIVLNHPEAASVGIRRRRRRRDVDLGVRAPVEIDDGKPWLPNESEQTQRGSRHDYLRPGDSHHS